MNTIIKKIGYCALHILNFGKGISKSINGISINFPTKYFRYFPVDYEKENFEIIQNSIKNGDVILDIGAHIGLMSVILGKKVGADGKIYSFEPSPDTFLVLKNTIALNKLQGLLFLLIKRFQLRMVL